MALFYSVFSKLRNHFKLHFMLLKVWKLLEWVILILIFTPFVLWKKKKTAFAAQALCCISLVDLFYIPSFLRGEGGDRGAVLMPWRSVDRPRSSQGEGKWMSLHTGLGNSMSTVWETCHLTIIFINIKRKMHAASQYCVPPATPWTSFPKFRFLLMWLLWY